MTVSSIFQNGYNQNEQNLVESLVIESIQLRGNDIAYLPRSDAKIDTIMDEDVNVQFDGNFLIEMLTTSVEGFQGDGHFMSQLGVEIRDQTVYQLSISRFVQVANAAGFNLSRPRESDLIFDQITGKIMEIKFVDKYVNNYQLGALYTYGIRCEEFEYSNQILNTGIPAVDAIANTLSQNILPLIVTDSNQDPVLDANGNLQFLTSNTGNFEASDDTVEIRKEAAEFTNWGEVDPFSESDHY